jgi:hypothetical protein
MSRHWFIVVAGIPIAAAIGFQQVEPLHELRNYGTVAPGGWWFDGDLHGHRFVAKDSSPTHFVNALPILQKCPSINRVAVPKSSELGRVLAQVAQLEHIVAIDLFDKEVSDEDLAGLAGMKQLKFLELSYNPRVTDAGIATLSGLENLRVLDLTSTSVTGTGLKDRADMVSLYQLKLTDCPVTDESLAAIPRFPKLEELLLAGTEVTDTGLMSLVGWHSLRRVTRTSRTTEDGARAFNEAFLADRRKAREAGVPMDPRSIPPIFFDGPRKWPVKEDAEPSDAAASP